MSDQRIFTRYKANEIRSELQIVDVKKIKSGVAKKKNALRKIIANLTLGNYSEMLLLLPEILKFWKIEDDMEVKRICHEYIRTIGSIKPRSTVESLPFILNDLRSRNEKVQIMALETLVSIPFSKFSEEAFDFIIHLTNKKTVPEQLMKNAIYSLVQLDDYDHERVMSLLNLLYDIVNHQIEKPTIQIAALNALCMIHDVDGNSQPVHISVETAFNILELLPTLNEWDSATLLEILPITVVPQTHDNAYDMIDMVLPHLQHVNSAVSLSALKMVLYLLNYIEEVNQTIIKRLSNSVIALLEKPAELQFLVLRNVILLLLSRDQSLLKFDVPYFFIEYNDPIYIKDTKLECLYLLSNEGTLPQILDELEEHATDIDIQMSRKAVRAIGNLAVKLGESSAGKCVDILLHLLEFGVDYVIQEIISVFRNILRKYPKDFKNDVKTLVKYVDYAQDTESRNAMIWIITHYSDILPDYLTLFETFCTNVLNESPEVQFSVLTSSIKFFVRYPSIETEKLCICLLRECTEDANNPDLRSRAFMYWRLLSLAREDGSNVTNEILKDIVDGELPKIELNTKLDPIVLEELELNVGSITSIYLKPTSQIFRMSSLKSLPNSPVLNSDKSLLNVIDDLRSIGISNSNDRLNGKNHNSNKNNNPVVHTMSDFDKPAEKVNHLKGSRKSSISSPSKLARKPSMLMRKLTLKKKF
ncbi:similar to Saccharomyces cerevisiae YJR005W APL1 Beta-adaptin, large subunit of the clathrin associated protein complex (AP-2) [Maudiozyma saulgeensis]|uniref:AP complex subunit beta n=1 Tax=Maudiozyma saulgeensis TaxID=1789683 RepID=A0A1X7QYX4_9SACH|nr:similar to Saccharomyces cerevisiae YJR005W APL1 Beta-adaptin, large subunit of the clathrin associated protein complex (AP-2) [Kazachstania saulgeensis]